MVPIGAGQIQISLAKGVTGLGRGFGLQAVIEHGLRRQTLSGRVYLFANRRRDAINSFLFYSGCIRVVAT